MSKNAALRIFEEGLGVLVPMPNRLVRWITGLGPFPSFMRHSLASFSCMLRLVVGKMWSGIALSEKFLPYGIVAAQHGETLRLGDNCIHDC